MIELGIPHEIKLLRNHEEDNHMIEPSHQSEHLELPKPDSCMNLPFQKGKLDQLIEKNAKWVNHNL